jgi:ufm1-conjugating enzyme 1
MVDASTKKALAGIPLLKTNAGPRDGDQWNERLKEELIALIQVHFEINSLKSQYVKTNKEQDNDWFRLESNKEGTKCDSFAFILFLTFP